MLTDPVLDFLSVFQRLLELLLIGRGTGVGGLRRQCDTAVRCQVAAPLFGSAMGRRLFDLVLRYPLGDQIVRHRLNATLRKVLVVAAVTLDAGIAIDRYIAGGLRVSVSLRVGVERGFVVGGEIGGVFVEEDVGVGRLQRSVGAGGMICRRGPRRSTGPRR